MGTAPGGEKTDTGRNGLGEIVVAFGEAVVKVAAKGFITLVGGATEHEAGLECFGHGNVGFFEDIRGGRGCVDIVVLEVLVAKGGNVTDDGRPPPYCSTTEMRDSICSL